MDVMGLNPTSERGEYFRNNLWWWRPLWAYCVDLAPDLCEGVAGHFNDGDGLDEEGAKDLSWRLTYAIYNGHTEEYKNEYYDYLASLPLEECKLCNGTGIRTDEVGMEMKMPERELDGELKIILGRGHGWCNGCGAQGKKTSFACEYPFSVENVREFAEFLADSGGFAIH
jgi:hypothetical protein